MTTTERRLHLHDFTLSSFVNGPGRRAVIWLQGCTLACPGCFNPGTHASTGGYYEHPAELARAIFRHSSELDGITISGGEPLQQPQALRHFLELIRANSNLSVVVFSGFSWDEIQKMPLHTELPELADVLIAGRYQQAQRIARGLQGSANKTFHFFTDRYSQDDFNEIPEAEVTIGADGEIFMSGIAPIDFYAL